LGNTALKIQPTSITWNKVKSKLRTKYGEDEFKSWINPISFVEQTGGQAVISAPTKFIKEWVLSNYMDDIKTLWQAEDKSIIAVDVFVISKKEKTYKTENNVATISNGSDDLTTNLDNRYKFSNFVVGKSNELAYAAAMRVAETPQTLSHTNPLFLYGGVGLGKTHLMHAITWHIKEHTPQRKVLYLSAEKFMYTFIRALRDKDTIGFKTQFRNVDVLIIDDVQFISGKESTQEEFFHTFNALIDNNKQIILSSDRLPSDLDGIKERVKSRLGWGLVIDIHETTYELRLGILHSKAEMAGMEIPQVVLEYLAHKITSNVRELEGALNRIIAHSTLVGREINLETTREVLRDLIRANEKVVSIDDIQKQVADKFNIKVSDMHSARRTIAIARPRQVAMYLSKILTPKSYPEIGRKFGGKDHTTVIHAVKKIEKLCAEDKEFAEDVDLLKKILNN